MKMSEAVRDWTQVKEEVCEELEALLESYYVQSEELVKHDSLIRLK